MCRAFRNDSPRGKESSVQQYTGKVGVVPVLFIQTEHEGLDHQVSESVRSRGKHVGDCGVNRFVVARVGGQLTGNEVRTNDVEQVVSECENLERRTLESVVNRKIPSVIN